VLSWRLSITLETDFCIEALEEALTRFGAPEIFNTDQGSQFTRMAFTRPAAREDRDQHGRARRLARQCVRRAPVALREIRGSLSAGLWLGQRGPRSIGRYLTFYNGRRPHSSLDRRTPDHVYFNQPLLAAS
jgi:putative transposase